MARTQPNLLDLIIALFSGAVGAVAICKEAKGVVTSVPLNRSYRQLSSEISYKQQQNRLRSAATEIWQKNFAEFADGKARSYISQLSFQERERQLVAQLQVVTSKVYTEAERSQYQQLLSVKLLWPLDSIALNLIQIPTASGDLLQQLSEATKPAPPPTTAQLQSGFLESAKQAIESLRLPPPARLVSYAASTSPVAPLKMQISYLSEREIDRDGQAVIVEDIRRQLDYPTAEVTFNRIAPILATVTFELNQAQIPPSQTKLLDQIGRVMQQNPTLQIELQSGQTPSEIGTLAQDRSLAIQNYLQTQWQIQPVGSGAQNERCYIVKTELATTPTVRLQTTIASLQSASTTDQIDAGETNLNR